MIQHSSFDSTPSAFDVSEPGSLLLARSTACLDSHPFAVGTVCFELTPPVFACMAVGPPLSLRGRGRPGAILFVSGESRLDLSLSIYEFSNSDAFLSLQSFQRLGPTL